MQLGFGVLLSVAFESERHNTNVGNRQATTAALPFVKFKLLDPSIMVHPREFHHNISFAHDGRPLFSPFQLRNHHHTFQRPAIAMSGIRQPNANGAYIFLAMLVSAPLPHLHKPLSPFCRCSFQMSSWDAAARTTSSLGTKDFESLPEAAARTTNTPPRRESRRSPESL